MPDERHFRPAEQDENVAHPDRALAGLAERQHGVVARRQLADIGVTLTMLESRVANGQLVRLHRGVYAVGHRQLRREGWWLAAVLAAGPGALLSHRDAAVLHGLLAPGDHRRVEVTTRRATSSDGIKVHRTSTLDAEDTTTRRGIPTTSVARTLVDLAATVGHDRLRKAMNEAERLGKLDVQALERALARTARRHGRGHNAMREALAEIQAQGIHVTRSELEDRFLSLVVTYGLPRPQMNATVEGMEVDAVWPAERVAVELDGWEYHRTKHAFQRDRDRANDLTQAGYTVLRFTYADVARRPQHVAARVARWLR